MLKSYKRWTKEDDKIITKFYPSNAPTEVAKLVNRSLKATKLRAARLGIRNTYAFWSKDDISYIKKKYPSLGPTRVAKFLNKSAASVCRFANQNGIRINKSKYIPNKQPCCGGTKSRFFTGHGIILGSYLCSIRNRNKTVTIDSKYLSSIVTNKCPISGIPLTYKKSARDITANASVDRIDSSKDYVPGNCQWVDKRINIMKSNLTEQQFYEYCKAVYLTLRNKYET